MIDAIGKELKILRIRNNLNIDDVANNFGLNRETIRRYEVGATDMSIERLESLLKFYNADKNIFFKNVCENMHE